MDAHSLLVAYHNWQSRLISENPRTVHPSSALNNNPLTQSYQEALATITADIAEGRPLTKYLSRGIKTAVALPGDSRSPQRRRDLDLMLNDWGIHHLHLSTTVETDGFVSRTGPLLFAIFNRNDAYILDILEHGSWTSQHLLEVLVREFPDSNTFHILNGVIGLSREIDGQSRRALRNHAINSPVMIDGKAILPRLGMVTTGTTVAAIRESDMVLEALSEFEETWNTEPERIRAMIPASGEALPIDPQFSFEVLASQGPIVFETQSRTFFRLFP